MAVILGWFLVQAVQTWSKNQRIITVKGLSEREYPANIAIWPIQFTTASNDLSDLYRQIETNNQNVRTFLKDTGFQDSEITIAPPAIVDKKAQQYSGSGPIDFRYVATQSVTVYTEKVEAVREASKDLISLGQMGITLGGDPYQTRIEFLFTQLNDVKPEMIEEATRNAREAALRFAEDSGSNLGKIKRAYQGQFSISDRDRGSPHIKKIRVVTTIDYYLVD
jgi:hypothetical protein